MLSMAKVIGDLMQGYAVHIGGGVLAIIVGSGIYDLLTTTMGAIGQHMGSQ